MTERLQNASDWMSSARANMPVVCSGSEKDRERNTK